MRRLVPVLALSLALVAAACGDDDQQAETTDDPSSSTTVPAGDATGAPGEGGSGDDGPVPAADGVLLTLDVHGGFVPLQSSVGNIAEVVVLTDGRVISGAPMTLQYPGPAMPPLQVSTAGADALADVVAAFEALDPDADYTQDTSQQIADAPDTTITLHKDGTTTSITAYALGMGDATGPRGELQAVVDALNGLATGTGETPYVPTALRVHDVTDLAGPPPTPAEGEPSGTVRDWPIPHDGAECSVVTDAAQVTAALDVLAESTQLDRFRTDAGERVLVVVPHLPGDPGCPES
jgi:hypothetical protein